MHSTDEVVSELIYRVNKTFIHEASELVRFLIGWPIFLLIKMRRNFERQVCL